MVKLICFLLMTNYIFTTFCQAIEKEKDLKKASCSFHLINLDHKTCIPFNSLHLKTSFHSPFLNKDLLRHIVSYIDMADAVHLAQTNSFFFQEPYQQSISVAFSSFMNRFQNTFSFYLEGALYLGKDSKVPNLILQPNRIGYIQLQEDEKKLFSFGLLSESLKKNFLENNFKDLKNASKQKGSFQEVIQYQIIQSLLLNLSNLDSYVLSNIVKTYCEIAPRNSLFFDWEKILCYELQKRIDTPNNLFIRNIANLKELANLQKGEIRTLEKKLISLTDNLNLFLIITDSNFQRDRQDFAFNLLLTSRPYLQPLSSRRDSRFKVLISLIDNANYNIEYKYQAALNILTSRQQDINLDYSPSIKKPSFINRDMISDYEYNSAPIKREKLLRDLNPLLAKLLEDLNENKRQVLQNAIDKNDSLCAIM